MAYLQSFCIPCFHTRIVLVHRGISSVLLWRARSLLLQKNKIVLVCKVSAETKNTRASSEASMFFRACGKFCQQANPPDRSFAAAGDPHVGSYEVLMKPSFISFLVVNIFTYFIFILTPKVAIASEPCDLSCMIYELDKAEQYNEMVNIYISEKKRALACKNIEDVLNFLRARKAVKGHVEISESWSETLERDFFQDRTTCLFNALLKLDEKARNDVIDEFKIPFVLDKNEIEQVLKKYRKNTKYKQIVNRYYKQLQ